VTDPLTAAAEPTRRRILRAFADGHGPGILALGARELSTALHPTLAFWRDFGKTLIGTVCGAVDPLATDAPALPEPFANTPQLSRRRLSRYDDAGPAWAWDVLEIGEHTGTHFDAPVHWISGKDGKDVASVEPSRLVGPAVVIDKSAECAEDPGYLLTVADFEAWEDAHGGIQPGSWVLFRSGWDARAHDAAEAKIAAADSKLGLWIIPTDEESMIAQHTRALLDRRRAAARA